MSSYAPKQIVQKGTRTTMQYILEGPALSEEMITIFKHYGYIATLATPSIVYGNLPYAAPTKISRNNGKLGATQIRDEIANNDFIIVTTDNKLYQEMAIRVVDRQTAGSVHIVFANNGDFAYVSISTRDFVKKFYKCSGNSALAKVRNFFTAIELKSIGCNEYIPAEQGWSYLQMRQKMGWNWRAY